MDLLKMVGQVLLKRGPFGIAWLCMIAATAFIYRAYGNPLTSTELTGMAFTYAIALLGIHQVNAMWRKRQTNSKVSVAPEGATAKVPVATEGAKRED